MTIEMVVVVLLFAGFVERLVEMVAKPLASMLRIPGFTGEEDFKKPVLFAAILGAGIAGQYFIEELAIAKPYFEQYSPFIVAIASAAGLMPVSTAIHDFLKGWRIRSGWDVVEIAAEVEDLNFGQP